MVHINNKDIIRIYNDLKHIVYIGHNPHGVCMEMIINYVTDLLYIISINIFAYILSILSVKCKIVTIKYCTALNYCKNYCMNNFRDSIFLRITTLILSREAD